METWMVVVLVGVLFVIGAAVVWFVVGKKRSDGLKSRFGSEYDRAVKSSGSRRRGEAELGSRTERVSRLDIHPLSPGDHDRFAERWRSTQASFVDSPGGAVSAAETLVEEVMRARGYPVGDFDQRAADISVDHPRFVTNYREARDLALANQNGSANTEDLRRATVHYRALFDDLLDPAEGLGIGMRR
jgi:hypothetical protein